MIATEVRLISPPRSEVATMFWIWIFGCGEDLLAAPVDLRQDLLDRIVDLLPALPTRANGLARMEQEDRRFGLFQSIDDPRKLGGLVLRALQVKGDRLQIKCGTQRGRGHHVLNTNVRQGVIYKVYKEVFKQGLPRPNASVRAGSVGPAAEENGLCRGHLPSSQRRGSFTSAWLDTEAPRVPSSGGPPSSSHPRLLMVPRLRFPRRCLLLQRSGDQ